MEKIDFVIAWVDGSDPNWQAEKKKYINSDVDLDCRYRDWNLLKYWFRGVEKFAPWVNRIHFVTWGHIPEWLNTEHPKLNIVNHGDFIPKKYLPTFNSHAIELNFHRIKDLAEQFVYFNDDMFLLDDVVPSDFFLNGKVKDTCALDVLRFDERSIAHIDKNNISAINDIYSKKKFIKENFLKLLNPVIGKKKVIKNLLLVPFDFFTGFYNHHLPTSFLKETYVKTWQQYYSILDETCLCKERESNNVSQYLLKDLQLVTNNFEQRSASFGKRYNLRIENIKICCDDIVNRRYKCLCLNDNELLDDIFFIQNELVKAFNTSLQNKSLFEKLRNNT